MKQCKYRQWHYPRLLAGCLLSFFWQVAYAQVDICNESKTLHYSTALAYWNHEVEEWVSRGWFRLRPKQCTTAVALPLAREHVYLHARYGIPAGKSSGNDFIDLMEYILLEGMSGSITGKYSFCTQQKNTFALVGLRRCVSRGFDLAEAVEIEPRKGAYKIIIELHDEGRYLFSVVR